MSLLEHVERHNLIIREIKIAIKRNMDEKALKIIKSNTKMLSRKDYRDIFDAAFNYKRCLTGVVKYIYLMNEFSPNQNVLLINTEKWGDVEVFKFILENMRYSPPCDECYIKSYILTGVFTNACRSGNIDIVSYLMTHPLNDLTYCNYIAFHKACSKGRTEIVKLLLADSRINPTLHDSDAFIKACGNGHIDVVRLLLEDGRSNYYAQSNNAIKCAFACFRFNIFILLVEIDYERNIPFDLIEGFLISAYHEGRKNMVKSILEIYRSGKYGQFEELVFSLESKGLQIKDILNFANFKHII